MDGTTVRDENRRLCVDIVEAVAAEAGADPLALSPPLYDVVDTEALGRLVASGADITVEFDYAGYIVTVDGDGAVTVDGSETAETQRAVDTPRGETP